MIIESLIIKMYLEEWKYYFMKLIYYYKINEKIILLNLDAQYKLIKFKRKYFDF